jgi:hypothetical protein
VTARAHRRWARFGTIGPVLACVDAAAVGLAGLAVASSADPVLGATAVAVLVAAAADLHRPRLVLSIVEDLPGLFVAAVAATVVLVATGSAPVASGLLVLACLVLGHTLVLGGTRLLRGMGRLCRRVLVVGTGGVARQLALSLFTRPELGLRPVGFVGTGSADQLDQARGLPLPLLGPVRDLPRAMTEAHVDGVVIALSGPAGADVAAAIEGLAPTDVYAVPASFPAAWPAADHSVERLRPHTTWPPVRVVKRMVEVVVAAVTLAVLLVPFLLLALLVRIETGGVLVRNPVRFRTRRARSVARPGTTFSVDISGRMGPVGRLLRRTRLVALPGLVWAQARRIRYACGVARPKPVGPMRVLATAPRADETQVDAGQLAR